MGRLPPLSSKWRGLARILRRLGPVSYLIQKVDTGIQLKAHLNHLKPYHPSEEFYAVNEEDMKGLEGAKEESKDDTNQLGVEVQDTGIPEDTWVSLLTSCARDP